MINLLFIALGVLINLLVERKKFRDYIKALVAKNKETPKTIDV